MRLRSKTHLAQDATSVSKLWQLNHKGIITLRCREFFMNIALLIAYEWQWELSYHLTTSNDWMKRLIINVYVLPSNLKFSCFFIRLVVLWLRSLWCSSRCLTSIYCYLNVLLFVLLIANKRNRENDIRSLDSKQANRLEMQEAWLCY